MLKSEQLIKYLRDSLFVQDPETATNEDLLAMTDKDLEAVLLVAVTRNYPETRDLDHVQNAMVYPVMLIAKKELYYRLCVKFGGNFDMEGFEAGKLFLNQQFTNYLNLVKQAEEEYANYMENGDGGATVYVRELTIPSRYRTRRNTNLAVPPTISLSVDETHDTYIEISWSANDIKMFSGYEVYLGTSPVYDPYQNFSISKEAVKVFSTHDILNTQCRIENLEADNIYYVGVVSKEKNGVNGFVQISIQM